MRRSQLGDAPLMMLEEFAKMKSGDVVLQARTNEDAIARTIRLRCVTEPDEAQKALLSRLWLTMPIRLRRIDDEPRGAEQLGQFANHVAVTCCTSDA
jgi:hypothetical protein